MQMPDAMRSNVRPTGARLLQRTLGDFARRSLGRAGATFANHLHCKTEQEGDCGAAENNRNEEFDGEVLQRVYRGIEVPEVNVRNNVETDSITHPCGG